MILALLAATTISASPALISPGLTGVGIEPARLAFFSEHLALKLTEQKLRVTTGADVSTLLGIERQKQLLGCGDQPQCVVEIASALGSDGIVLGAIAKFEDGWQVNLKVIGAIDGRTLSAFTRKVPSEAKVRDALEDAAKAMAAELLKALRPPIAVPIAPDGGKALTGAAAQGRCVAQGKCSAATDCCPGLGCDSSKGECVAAMRDGRLLDGQLCESHDRCLYGVCNKGGVCKAPTTCRGIRNGCSASSPCCPQTRGQCSASFCLLPAGESCALDGACVSGECSAGRCE